MINATFTMKLLAVLLAFCTQTLAAAASLSDLTDSAVVYIQSIESSSTTISRLAEIIYNPFTASAELILFDAPELSPESKLVRIGAYDFATSTWKSSTSMTSAESFSKGYSPTLVLSLDEQGALVGVTCKSGKIDAGQTRDFGPKVKVLKTGKRKLPDLNMPVVLSPEGKLEEPLPEKTVLQK